MYVKKEIIKLILENKKSLMKLIRKWFEISARQFLAQSSDLVTYELLISCSTVLLPSALWCFDIKNAVKICTHETTQMLVSEFFSTCIVILNLQPTFHLMKANILI